jgi:hypothetical protein
MKSVKKTPIEILKFILKAVSQNISADEKD